VHISTQIFSKELEFTMALNCINLHQKSSEGFGAAPDLLGAYEAPWTPPPESMA